jgi:hypothetical protein
MDKHTEQMMAAYIAGYMKEWAWGRDNHPLPVTPATEAEAAVHAFQKAVEYCLRGAK